MNAYRPLLAFLLLLALGLPAMAPAQPEAKPDTCCPEADCQDCSQCPDCTISQLQAPAIPQPVATVERTETDSRLCTRSEEPIVRQASSGIFRPPRTS